MPTGQAALQAAQVVHDQSASSSTQVVSGNAAPSSTADRRPSTISRGRRGLPAAQAGQTELHRPQVVQASICNRSSRESWSQVTAPGGDRAAGGPIDNGTVA